MSTMAITKAKKKASQSAVSARSLAPQRRLDIPHLMEEASASPKRLRSEPWDEPSFRYDFQQIPVQPSIHATLTNTATQPAMESCPFALNSPRACPFGGVCNSCPARVQAKLTIGQPGDTYEKEADQVADAVMRLPENGLLSQREPKEEEQVIPASAKPSQNKQVLESQVTDLFGAGQPLDPATRAFMEPRFRHDFSQVRVHTSSRAEETSLGLGARAFTAGNALVFAPGQYAPRTERGNRLIAHELTHVLQQQMSGSVRGKVQSKLFDGDVDNHSDREWKISGSHNNRPEDFLCLPGKTKSDDMPEVKTKFCGDVDAVWPDGSDISYIGPGQIKHDSVTSTGAFKLRDYRSTEIFGTAKEGYRIISYTEYKPSDTPIFEGHQWRLAGPRCR